MCEDHRIVESHQLLERHIDSKRIPQPRDEKLDLLVLGQGRVMTSERDETLGEGVDRTHPTKPGELPNRAVSERWSKPCIHELNELVLCCPPHPPPPFSSIR
jgi:hypothetical protein